MKEDQRQVLAGDCAILELMIAQLEHWDFSTYEKLPPDLRVVIEAARERHIQRFTEQLTYKKNLLDGRRRF